MNRATPQQFKLLALGAALFTLVELLWVRREWGGFESTLVFMDAAAFATPLVAAAACIHRAESESGLPRTGWRLLAFGCIAWALGDVAWAYNELWLQRGIPAELRDVPPVPYWSDVGYLALVPLAAAGIMLIPKGMFRFGSRLRVLHNAALMGLSLLAVTLAVGLLPRFAPDYDSVHQVVVLLAYPATDAVLIAMALSAAIYSPPEERPGLRLIIGGLAVLAVTDTWFYFFLGTGSSHIPLMYAGWPAGFLLIALGAIRPDRVSDSLEPAAAEMLDRIPILLGVAALGAIAWLAARHDLPGPVTFTAGLLLGVLVWRTVNAMGDRARLKELQGLRGT